MVGPSDVRMHRRNVVQVIACKTTYREARHAEVQQVLDPGAFSEIVRLHESRYRQQRACMQNGSLVCSDETS
eukprot:4450350-Lingulodinium_polyedra.AAC.1